ncbi:MAG: DUF4381 family protein [Deltaproteobacteria bacterium]|jgi:hypothetical protein|nr:DUF4381 family protein [Deltaproteobacteria bacterium]
MSGRIFRLLPALVLGLGCMVGPGICVAANPPLKLVPDPQQGQVSPMAQNMASADMFHDIRGPVALPDSLGVLVWLLIGLAVVALAALLLYLWKRRKKERKLPCPHEIALNELTRLRPMMNPEQALIYAAQLSEILRRYIEARFLIHSTRQTTREFFTALVSSPQIGSSMAEHRDHLRECLEQCDMAKFAHCVPDLQDMEAMEQAVRGFIEATGESVDEKGKG